MIAHLQQQYCSDIHDLQMLVKGCCGKMQYIIFYIVFNLSVPFNLIYFVFIRLCNAIWKSMEKSFQHFKYGYVFTSLIDIDF